jgi:hypothetical protein
MGETVRVSLQILEATLETLAVVRPSHSTRSGFEFLDLSPAHQQQLEDRVHAMEGHSWPWQSESANPAVHAQRPRLAESPPGRWLTALADGLLSQTERDNYSNSVSLRQN